MLEGVAPVVLEGVALVVADSAGTCSGVVLLLVLLLAPVPVGDGVEVLLLEPSSRLVLTPSIAGWAGELCLSPPDEEAPETGGAVVDKGGVEEVVVAAGELAELGCRCTAVVVGLGAG